MSARTSLRRWLDQRLPMTSIEAALRAQATKRLPGHVGWLHTMGGLLIFLTLHQIVTGVLLMVYYRAHPDDAYQSVRFLMTRASFGWLIRGLHAWGSTLMIVVLVLHMLRTFLMGSFKKPRELTWVTGALLFFVVLAFGFTGYLLPWNQVAYWATTVGTEVAASIPWLGEDLARLLRGGDGVTGETLSRFYLVHVVVLPWLLVGLIVAHVALVRMLNLAPLTPVGVEEKPPPGEGVPFAPHHVARELVVFPLFFALLVALVLVFPPEVGEQADPGATPAGIKPEWYFLPSYQLLKYFPELLGLAVSMLPPLLLVIWPFLDRTPERRPSRRKLSVAIGLFALLAALAFGVLGALSERTVEIGGTRVRFDSKGVPSLVEGEEAAGGGG